MQNTYNLASPEIPTPNTFSFSRYSIQLIVYESVLDIIKEFKLFIENNLSMLLSLPTTIYVSA